MKLDEYLKENGHSLRWFADKCGISYATIWRIGKGDKVNRLIAEKINEMTEGEVTMESIVKQKKVKKKETKDGE